MERDKLVTHRDAWFEYRALFAVNASCLGDLWLNFFFPAWVDITVLVSCCKTWFCISKINNLERVIGWKELRAHTFLGISVTVTRETELRAHTAHRISTLESETSNGQDLTRLVNELAVMGPPPRHLTDVIVRVSLWKALLTGKVAKVDQLRCTSLSLSPQTLNNILGSQKVEPTVAAHLSLSPHTLNNILVKC